MAGGEASEGGSDGGKKEQRNLGKANERVREAPTHVQVPPDKIQTE